MAVDQKELVNVFDYEAAAREILPKLAYDYYRSGANDEITLHENHTAYERIKLKPRVLRDISKRDLTTTILGQTSSMPILVAPTAFHCLAHPEGEVATARAAGSSVYTVMPLVNHQPAARHVPRHHRIRAVRRHVPTATSTARIESSIADRLPRRDCWEVP